MASGRRREASSEEPQFSRFKNEIDFPRTTERAHRIGRHTYENGETTRSLAGFRFSSSGGTDARAIHLDGEGFNLSRVEQELKARDLFAAGDLIHEVKLAPGGGGVNVLVSSARLNPKFAGIAEKNR